jgi:hypothetical protein
MNLPATTDATTDPAAALLAQIDLLDDILDDAWDNARHTDDDARTDAIANLRRLVQAYQQKVQRAARQR